MKSKTGKTAYDLAISFGPVCSCSQTLRRAKLQYLSSPLDWIGPTTKDASMEDMRRRANLLASEFVDWLRAEDFEYLGPNTNGMEQYWNPRLMMSFVHDFPLGVPFAESFPKIKAKYERRTARLLGLIRNAKRVLIFRLDRPDIDAPTPVGQCEEVIGILERKFPGTKFDVVLMQSERSRPFAERTVEEIAPGVTRIAFDYFDPEAAESEPWRPRMHETSAAIAAVASVADYRNADEIAAYKRAEAKRKQERRMKRWQKYGATNPLEYLWRRICAAVTNRKPQTT